MGDGSGNFEILIRVSQMTQLFHSLDPSPFRERDLDLEAEKYIVSWAQEAPRDATFAITIEMPRDQAQADAEGVIAAAFHNHFEYQAGLATRALRELFREGWRALLIGIPILALSLLLSHLMSNVAIPSLRLISESLLILGWVANWRPLEIFLYGWWPIIRRRNLYRGLAAARVRVRAI